MTSPNQGDRPFGPPLDGRPVPPSELPHKPRTLMPVIALEVVALVVFVVATHSFSVKEKWTAVVFWAMVILIFATVWQSLRLRDGQRNRPQ